MKVIGLAVALLALPAAAHAANHHHHHISRGARGAYAAQPEIACTQVGCAPVPRGCHRESGRTFSGDPSGFDIAACPGYTMYGTR